MTAAEIEVPFSFLNVRYAKKFGKFNNGVLAGNWFEERVRLDDQHQAERAGTTLKTLKPCDLCCFGEKLRHRMPDHWRPKDASMTANRRVAAFETRRHSSAPRSSMKEFMTDDTTEFGDNLTSKYTLDFGPHSTRADPLRSYGNLTHFGLRDWHTCMRNTTDARCCYTLMQENFRCHKYAALQTQRRATPAAWSTKLNRTNLTNKDLVLRENRALNIANNSAIVVQ